VQTLNEGGNTSVKAATAAECGQQNIQNNIIGNLSSKHFSERERKLLEEKPNNHSKGDPIRSSLRHQINESHVVQENQLKSELQTNDSFGLYNPHFSLIKESEGTNFSEERLIEEIEVDSAFNLNVNEQEFCDSYEGKCLIISNFSKFK
jgi:hypothetical protein